MPRRTWKTIGVVFAMLAAAAVAAAQTVATETGPAAAPVHAGTVDPAPASGPTTAAAPAASPGAATAPPRAGGGTEVRVVRVGEEEAVASYALQLRELEQRINQLKQEVFRSKARLAQLAETVIQGGAAGRSKIRIVHRNEMGGTFRLVKLAYFLNRSPVYNETDETGELGDMREIPIYESIIVPGDHTISVEAEYRGHGYGIFSYLEGYRFRVNDSLTVTISGGKEVTIQGIGYERGGPLEAIEDRPAIRFTEEVRDLATGLAGGE